MNILKILDHFHIDYVTEHQKMSKTSVAQVCCPFCGESNYKRGMFPNGLNTCWKCGNTRSLYLLIKEIRNVSYDTFIAVAGGGNHFESNDIKRNLDSILESANKPVETEQKHFEMPSIGLRLILQETENEIPKLIKDFCNDRNFRINRLYFEHYGISGDLQGYLVIKIFDYVKATLVGFAARDLTNTALSKWKFPANVHIHDHIYCTLFRHQLKYSLNNKKIVFIVEGIFDAWAVQEVGGIAVALFGTHLHSKQLLKILDMFTPDYSICIMLDSDMGLNVIHKISNQLEPYYKHVEIIKLKEGDPCSIKRNKLSSIVKHPFIELERE